MPRPNFKQYPELSYNQLARYGLVSPHKQMVREERVKVEKVIDGDTISVTSKKRKFKFPVRFGNIAAPELSENKGNDSKLWLKNLIEGKEVLLKIDRFSRAGKYGRLIAKVYYQGHDVGMWSVRQGKSMLYNKSKNRTRLLFK